MTTYPIIVECLSEDIMPVIPSLYTLHNPSSPSYLRERVSFARAMYIFPVDLTIEPYSSSLPTTPIVTLPPFQSMLSDF